MNNIFVSVYLRGERKIYAKTGNMQVTKITDKSKTTPMTFAQIVHRRIVIVLHNDLMRS